MEKFLTRFHAPIKSCGNFKRGFQGFKGERKKKISFQPSGEWNAEVRRKKFVGAFLERKEGCRVVNGDGKKP